MQKKKNNKKKASKGQGSAPKKTKATNQQVMVKATGGGDHGFLDPMTGLSKVAQIYAASLANPTIDMEAALPSFPAMMTRKMHVYSKGVFSTGTLASGNFGWILFDPLRAAVQDLDCVDISLTTSTSTLALQTVPVVGDALFAFSNSEYLAASIGVTPLAQFRLVSACIRVRYIGTNLNEGGQLVGLMDPNHGSLAGKTFANFDAYDESVRFPVDKKWTMISWKPVEASDLSFVSAFPAKGNATYPMGFAVQGPSGVQIPLEYEVYANFEFTGTNVRQKTPSPVDTLGFDAVHAITATGDIGSPHQKDPKAHAAQTTKAAGAYLHRVGSKPHPKSKSGWDTAGDILKGIGGVAGSILSFL